ncbi:uncharacterized protein PG998_006756 [Apiospora kogelbergensis]|uniref:uncharacterized protein n=1 Tax=Apiospora kogelbergensis TaxID=1337665 RepID=UPI00312E9F64
MTTNTAGTSFPATSITVRTLLAAALLLAAAPPPVHAVPRAARWSTKSLGPDGPWNALEITMGKGQTVTTYAGKMWESFFLDSGYCNATASQGANGKPQPCYAKQAGAIYNETTKTGSMLPAVSSSPGSYFSGAMDTSPGSKSNGPDRYRDEFHLGRDTTQWGADTVPNLDMVLLSETQLKYPGGDLFPLFAGCLGLGAAPGIVNHTYNIKSSSGSSSSSSSKSDADNNGSVSLGLVAGTYAKQGYTDTNSFGMHIGSAVASASSPKKKMMEGSLWFGGYDKNRVIGEVLAVPIPQPYVLFDGLPLVDISINVSSGAGWRSKSGYLAAGNATMGSQLNVRLDGCAPYLNLPKSTCDALAADLPVTYQPKLGLYTWDIASPDHARIVSSATALTFTFLDPDNNARRVNVSVPFAHLNLTLDAPLAETPTPYFPCNAAASGGRYALGRAFLQDAFFGASFDSAVFFLAQAPGPNIAVAAENPAAIAKTARTLAASNNDWKTSWDGVWTPLPGGGGEENDPTTKSADGESGGGVSHNVGLIVALAVGIGGGVSLLALITFVMRRRNKSGKGFACCGLRVMKDKEQAGDYVPTTPRSPNPEQHPQHQQRQEEAYKQPGQQYYPHELPLNEVPAQLPDIMISSPTETASSIPENIAHEEQPQRQVFEMPGDEDYRSRGR